LKPIEQNSLVRLCNYWLNDFVDAMLIVICRLLLCVGMIIGTIGVLSARFHLTGVPNFDLTWSIIQAVAIDGMFFSVWGIWVKSRGLGWIRSWYFCIGILLGCVASLVNNVISYAEISDISGVTIAMQQLHIDLATFTMLRSALVVLVSILIMTLPKGAPEQSNVLPETTSDSITLRLLTVIEELSMQKQLTVLPGISTERSDHSNNLTNQHAEIQLEHAETQGINQLVKPIGTSDFDDEYDRKGGYGDRIAKLLLLNSDLSSTDIAEIVGCSERTAYKWRKRCTQPEPINGHAEQHTDPLGLPILAVE
jgi:Homeodomain-like domain